MTYRFIEPDDADPRLHLTRCYKMLVGGVSIDAASGEVLRRESPAHPHVEVGSWPKADRRDSESAVAAARVAFDEGRWPRMSAAERSRLLMRVAELILRDAEELATIECLEVGKPITQARGEIAHCADLWSYAASQVRSLTGETHNGLGPDRLGLVLREPAGVVSIITPWNFPLVVVSERLPWALGAGCTTIIKPSEFTSGTTIRLVELIREAGVPDGVVNVVTGFGESAGQILAEDPRVDMLAFTGSVRVGRLLGGLSAQTIKRVGLELGGKGAQVVFADADIDRAVAAVVHGATLNAGQCCTAGSRLIIETSIAEAFNERLVQAFETIRVGDPLHEDTQVGPLITAAHMAKVEACVADGRAAGAKLLSGGGRLGSVGLFYAPTLFTNVTASMSIAQDEIFGPVLSTLTFDSVDQAVHLANGTSYGLSASVWSTTIDTAIEAIRRIRAGRTYINGAMDGGPELPVGGYKQSGTGRELGRLGFDEYSEFKTVQIVRGPRN